MLVNKNFDLQHRNIYPYIWQVAGRSIPFIFTYVAQHIFFDNYGSAQFSYFWAISISWIIINSFLSGGVDQFYAAHSKKFKFKYIFFEKICLVSISNIICLSIFTIIGQNFLQVLYTVMGITFLSLTELLLLNHRVRQRDKYVLYPRLFQSLILLLLVYNESIRSNLTFEFCFFISWFFPFILLCYGQRLEIKFQTVKFHKAARTIKRYFAFGAPVAFSQVWSNSDYISLTFFVSAADAGNYRYIWYIAFATAPIYAAISTVHLTSIAIRDKEKNEYSISTNAKIHYIAIFIMSFSDILLMLYLNYIKFLPSFILFEDNFSYLILLKISMFFNSSNVIIANLITYYRRQIYNVYISLWWAAIAIAISFFLTGYMSLFGAAVSSLIINFGMLLTYLSVLKKVRDPRVRATNVISL